MEVATRIHRLEAPMGERIVAVYLLAGEEHLLIVDTGLADTPSTYIKPYLDEHNLAPAGAPFVLVTHADNDHFGGNGPLKQMMPGAIFMCHVLDQPFVEDVDRLINERYDEWATGHRLPLDERAKAWVRETTETAAIDIGLNGGEQLRLDANWHVDVLHTPGHSRGHLTVWDADSGTAIIADAALWNSVPDTHGKPVLPPTYRYVELYVATLHHLRQLPISLLLTSHYPVYHGPAVADFIQGSLAFVEQVDNALKRTLQAAGRGRTLKQLIEELSPRLGEWPDSAANFLTHPLTGHLERLERYGQVECSERDGVITYNWRR